MMLKYLKISKNLGVKRLLGSLLFIFITQGMLSIAEAKFNEVEQAKAEVMVLDELLSEGLITQQQYRLKKQLLVPVQNIVKSKNLKAGTGSISGQIVNENGNPVEFQTIRLVDANTLTVLIASVETDSLGNFNFLNLEAGDYVLYSSGNGYLSYVWQSASTGGPRLCAGCVSSITSDNYISVSVGESVAGIDISTRLGGVVSGFIQDVNTQMGVNTFTVYLYNTVETMYTTSTSVIDINTGEYSVDAVPNGTYKLYLIANANNVHIPQLYPGSQCNSCVDLALQGQGIDLVIDNYNTINDIDFDLNIGASISGKIVDAISGNALPDLTAFLIFDELNHFLFYEVLIGTNIDPSFTGDYTIGGLLPGSYYIQGGDLGRDFYQREVYDNKACYWSGCVRSDGDALVVRSQEAVTGVDFLLERGGKISGTITSGGLPITDANVQVQFFDSSGSVVGGARAKADGTYTSARALPAGDYAVRTGNLFAGVLTRPYVNEKYNDIICSGLACDLTTADINVMVDNTTTGIDFDLNTGLSFTGVITEQGTGNPIPDVHVLVYKDMGDGTVKFANWATTNDGSTAAIGSFEVTGLPAGTYYTITNNGSNLPFLGFRPANGLGWLDILYDGMLCPANGCDIITGTPIVLTNNKAATAALDITMTQGASISGKVTDDILHSPIGDVQINVYNQNGDYFGSYTTDDGGQYHTAGFPADTYYLTTTTFEVLIDMKYGDTPCYVGSCDPLDAKPIVLAAQQSKSNVDFELIPASDFVFTGSFE